MVTKAIEEQVEKALCMGYARILWKEEDGSWGARVLEFPGCFAAAATPDETMQQLDYAMEDWLDHFLEQGNELPEPIQDREYKARMALNLPDFVRGEVATLAAAEGRTVNSWLTNAITKAAFEAQSGPREDAAKSDG